MKTTQYLDPEIRTICRYDLHHYQQAKAVANGYKGQERQDAYGRRCRIIARNAELVKKKTTDEGRSLLDLCYLSRETVSVEAAADILGICKSKAYMLLNKAIIDYAKRMGYIDKQKGGTSGGF